MITNAWMPLLTSPDSVPKESLRRALLGFAEENGWRPSDQILAYPGTERFARGHILVEHGLTHSAVLSFLRRDITFDDLDRDEKFRVLSISYNNLVDWHCFPNNRGQLVVYNRAYKASEMSIDLDHRSDAWRVEAFDAVIGRRPNPNFPALDEALIQTISRWKRILASELRLGKNTAPIAELFNAILFARAMEDNRQFQPSGRGVLIEILGDSPDQPIRHILRQAIEKLSPRQSAIPAGFIDETSLEVFDSLDDATKSEMFSEFYQNKFAPYRYDFSVITKHALSRIYERYISMLEEKTPQQLTLFGSEIDEVANRTQGGIYTPQFIARFFARFLEVNHSPSRFVRLRVIDPACGSGMFLRTLLELQCDPRRSTNLRVTTAAAFANVRGIDVDANACKAARLSLCLLYLSLTGEFPEAIAIDNANAIEVISQHQDMLDSYDAVIANPPYVRWEKMPENLQNLIISYLGALRQGRTDLYIAFLKAGLDILSPGGFLLYVLPRSFLVANNAEKLRAVIAETCWMHVLVDLSDIDVFGEVNAYPILLVVQKKGTGVEAPRALVARCSGFVGHALQDVIAGNTTKTSTYSIYAVEQSRFYGDSWRVSTPEQANLLARFSVFPHLTDFLEVRQGLITGMDKVFIRAKSATPKSERAVYIDFLSDRQIDKYRVPKETDRVVFYPYEGERLLSTTEVRQRFPETWRYLESNESRLKERKSMSRLPADRWWQPVWTRAPRALLRPKIVTPHLILFPRFALDAEGKYGVSHAPYLFPSRTAPGEEIEILTYFLAVLNSSAAHWQMITLSGKYRHGYAVLEPATLKKVRVPSPAMISPTVMGTIRHHVGKLVDPEWERDGSAVEELDRIISDLYGIDLDYVSEVMIDGGGQGDGD